MINQIKINRTVLHSYIVKRLIIIFSVLLYNLTVIAQIGYLNIDTKSVNQIKTLFTNLSIDEETKIVAIGETHSFYAENTVLITTVFETLSQRLENFNLVLERPFAESYLINEYLKNGDTTIFEYANNRYDNYHKQLKQLKKIYDKTENKFEVIGLDISGKEFREVCLLATRNMFDQQKKSSTKINAELSKEFETLEKMSITWWKAKHKRKLKKICQKIYLNLETNKEYSNEKKYFGENWKNITQVIKNYYLGTLYREYDEIKMQQREDILYKRLKKLIAGNPNSKYLVHFGGEHVAKDKHACKCKGIKKSFISKLHDEKINIISISTVYNYNSNHYIYRKFNWDGQKAMLLSQFNDSQVLDKIEKISFDGNNYLIETKGTTSSKNYDYVLVLNTILGNIEWQ